MKGFRTFLYTLMRLQGDYQRGRKGRIGQRGNYRTGRRGDVSQEISRILTSKSTRSILRRIFK
jgi:hypothetical protein